MISVTAKNFDPGAIFNRCLDPNFLVFVLGDFFHLGVFFRFCGLARKGGEKVETWMFLLATGIGLIIIFGVIDE